MVVEVRILGGLDQHVKDATFLEPLHLTLTPGARVADLVSHLGLEGKLVIAIVDGSRADLDFPLADGARIALFPPVGGG